MAAISTLRNDLPRIQHQGAAASAVPLTGSRGGLNSIPQAAAVDCLNRLVLLAAEVGHGDDDHHGERRAGDRPQRPGELLAG